MFLPKDGDLDAMKQNIAIIVCRLVRRHMKFFRKNANPNHITHQFSKEMAQKSEIVSFLMSVLWLICVVYVRRYPLELL